MSIMDFCPECGTRLISKREKEGTKNTLQMVCPKCGYKKSGKNRPSVTPKSIQRSPKESITVIGKEHQIRTLPTARKTCPKCGEGVFLAEHKNRVSCGKCGYTEFKKKEEPKPKEKEEKVPTPDTGAPSLFEE